MSDRNPRILHVHLDGADPYQLGDDLPQSLSDAIRTEAELIAEMTAALHQVGDTYAAPDGVAYKLTDETQLDLPARQDRLVTMSSTIPAPIVEEVLRLEDLPSGPSSGDGPKGL